MENTHFWQDSLIFRVIHQTRQADVVSVLAAVDQNGNDLRCGIASEKSKDHAAENPVPRYQWPAREVKLMYRSKIVIDDARVALVEFCSRPKSVSGFPLSSKSAGRNGNM